MLERQETGNKEPQYYQQRQAIFVQNEAIDPPSRPNEPSHRIFRVTVPADTRGQLDASYRTEATAIVNVRHRFARDAGEIPRSQLPAVRPRHLDAEGNLRRVRVLSLDGGGVRGTAEAMILIEILRHVALAGTTQKVHEQFDMICGTSTGGLFAMALGLRGVEPEDLKLLWGEEAQKIFSREWNFMGKKFGEETTTVGGLHLGLLSERLKYEHRHIERVLEDYFEDEFMDTQKWLGDDTAKVCVVSHILDVVPLTPFVIRSYELPPERAAAQVSGSSAFALGDWRLSCLEAGRATSAAPTYFEPITIWRAWEAALFRGEEENDDYPGGADELVKRPRREEVLAELQEKGDMALEDVNNLLNTGEVPRDKTLNKTDHAAWTQLTATALASDLALMLF